MVLTPGQRLAMESRATRRRVKALGLVVVLISKSAGPSNWYQSLVGIENGKFVHSPRLVFRFMVKPIAE